ncbi:MAG: helix-turn-helix domain-containing protein [Janthinobacterium lividum]
MSRLRVVQPLTVAELLRIDPLRAAEVAHLPDPARQVERVVLAETVDRVKRVTPHAVVVLHAEAATGGWSLAAALHLAWERNASAVVVSRHVASVSGTALAQRLHMALLLVDEDPVDLALDLAGHVTAPAAARAARRAHVAERLVDQTTLRGVLGVLNDALAPVPVALVVGGTVSAGRAAALADRLGTVRVTVPIDGADDRAWGQLVAAVPAGGAEIGAQASDVLRLARPALLAAWAHSRLDSGASVAHEQAAFSLLRRLSREPAGSGDGTVEASDVEPPAWSVGLGWRVGGANRAVWIAPSQSSDAIPDELTHLLRAAWQRGRPDWPLVAQGDGWTSWYSGREPNDTAPLRRSLSAFARAAAAHRLVLGVGLSHEGVPGLMRSVAEARLAARVAREEGPGAVRWFDGVGAVAALAWLPVAEIAQVAELCLPELVAAHDREAVVVAALVLLDCGGSLSKASIRLGVHRNTVLARVGRARQLGLALDDPTQRLALHVLCHALATSWDVVPTSGPPPAVRRSDA